MELATTDVQHRFDDLVTRILARFNKGTHANLAANVEASLGEIAELVGADYAHVVQTAADQSTWSVAYEWCSPCAPSQLAEYQGVPMGSWDWTEQKLLSGQTLLMNHLEDLPPEAAEQMKSVGFQSTLQVPIRGPEGKVTGCIALSTIDREVTWAEADIRRLRLVGEAFANTLERVQVERELRESERRYRATFEQAAVGILNVAKDGRLLVANQQFCQTLGYSHDEVLGRNYSDFIHPDDLDPTAKLFQKLMADRDVHDTLETRYLRKDGEVTWGNVTLSLLAEDVSHPPVFVAVIEDITVRRKAAETFDLLAELRRSDAALRAAHEELKQRRALAVAASLDGVWEWQRESGQVHYSARFAELLGYQAGDVPHTLEFFRSCLHPDDSPAMWTVVEQHFSEGTPCDVECRLRTKDGDYHWFRLRGRAQRDEGKQPAWMAGAIQDIHAQKTAEVDLRMALQEVERLSERLQAENNYLQSELVSSREFDEIIGESEPLLNMLTQIEHVATTEASVLLLGETGTGKELLARAIHERSPRQHRPLVKVNLAALSSSLIESELFGHVKGAFTGALTNKIGRFQLADGGTLFLDEVGEVDPELQTKLLRVLQEGEFERIGSTETCKVDVRIVAATNRNLRHAMDTNNFRSDLYYRLAVFPIEVPPLRLRRADIPLLAWHFIIKKQARLGKAIDRVPDNVMLTLIQYDWPGNIRELENVIERALILTTGKTLNLREPLINVPRLPNVEQATGLQELNRLQILAALQACRWKIKGAGNAAERLGLKPSTLRYRMKVLGIQRPTKDVN